VDDPIWRAGRTRKQMPVPILLGGVRLSTSASATIAPEDTRLKGIVGAVRSEFNYHSRLEPACMPHAYADYYYIEVLFLKVTVF
jgi:hypothetical protein